MWNIPFLKAPNQLGQGQTGHTTYPDESNLLVFCSNNWSDLMWEKRLCREAFQHTIFLGDKIRLGSYVVYSFVSFKLCPKLYTPSTLNIDLILWHTQLIMCAVK